MTSQSSSSESSSGGGDKTRLGASGRASDAGDAKRSEEKATRKRKSRSRKRHRSSSTDSSSTSDASDHGGEKTDSSSNGGSGTFLEAILNANEIAAKEERQRKRERSSGATDKTDSGDKDLEKESRDESTKISVDSRSKLNRPKSAKYRGRSLRHRKEPLDSVGSSSNSSVATQEEEFDRQDYDSAKQALLQYRASHLRELLLHSYLDHSHAKSLNKHGAYYERYNSRRSAPEQTDRSARNQRSKRGRGKLEKTRTAYAASRSQTQEATVLSPDHEAALKQAARSLAEEIVRLHQRRMREEAKDKAREMRPKTSKGRRGVAVDATPSSDRTNEESNAADDSKSASSQKHVKVVAPAEEEEHLSENRPDPNLSSTAGEHKSILKNRVRDAKKPPRPQTALVTSFRSRQRRNRGPTIAPGVYERDREALGSGTLDYYTLPNSSGELFSYSYLAALLNTLRLDGGDSTPKKKPDQVLQVTLRHAPKRPKTAAGGDRQGALARPGRKVRKPKASKEIQTDPDGGISVEQNDVHRKDKELVVDEVEKKTKMASRPKTAPQIRPGSDNIKCNWQPESEVENKGPKASDHQLKNTDNPTVADWLKRKNELQRRQRIQTSRKNRVKREILMNEYNDREDKREQALVEYERWKKRKNREILLRRRKEIAESNSKAQKPQANNKPGTVTSESSAVPRDVEADNNVTTFADLRSSAATPSVQPKSSMQNRRRPKSAPTKVSFATPAARYAQKPDKPAYHNDLLIPVKLDFENGGVELLSHDDAAGNLSAREPLMHHCVGASEHKTNSFLDNFMEVTSPRASMFDIPPPGSFNTDSGKESDAAEHEGELQIGNKSVTDGAGSRDLYNSWVRNKASTKGRPQTAKSFPSGRRSPNKAKKLKNVDQPQHNPLNNELISDLAKRRIQKILDSKKEVDSGLGPNRPRSAIPRELPAVESGETAKKWKLREDVEALETVSRSVDFQVSSPKGRKLFPTRDQQRPVFTYDRKSKSKSVFFERNPVVRRAANE